MSIHGFSTDSHGGPGRSGPTMVFGGGSAATDGTPPPRGSVMECGSPCRYQSQGRFSPDDEALCVESLRLYFPRTSAAISSMKTPV